MSKSIHIDPNDIFERLTFSELLENIREDLEIKPIEMAKKLEISRQQYNNIINGNAPVSVKLAADFAKKLEHPEVLFVATAVEDLLARNELQYKVDLKAM